MAWNGASYLVVGLDNRGTTYDIYGARVSGTHGAVLDANGIAISTAGRDQYNPAVAWDGTNYLVGAWQDYRSGGSYDIYGARIGGTDGTLLDAAGIVISAAVNAQEYPAVAWDGANYLVAWQDRRGSVEWDVRGALLTSAGAFVPDKGDFAISTGTGHQLSPAVAWDGTNYLVVWKDSRNGTDFDVFGARVSGADGATLDATGFAISAASSDQGWPALAWAGAPTWWSGRITGAGSPGTSTARG